MAQRQNDLIDRAVTLREQGRDDEALPLLQQAYAEQHSGRAAAQLGLCFQAVGDWTQAYVYLTEAVGGQDPWVESHRVALVGSVRIVEEQVGTLEVRSDVPGAEVLVNDVVVATLPMRPVPVLVGRVSLRVRAEGRRPFTLEVTIRPGQLTRQLATLTALSESGVEPQTGPRATPQTEPILASPIESSGPLDTAPTPARGEQVHETWWFWTVIGVLVAGAAVTVAVVATSSGGVEAPLDGSLGNTAAITFEGL